VEDTEYLARAAKKGITPRMTLGMSCQNNPDSVSYNIVAEYTGQVGW
jgi:hypothetical protein